jgi:hypothetical protein
LAAFLLEAYHQVASYMVEACSLVEEGLEDLLEAIIEESFPIQN